jgi:hypothetical protein
MPTLLVGWRSFLSLNYQPPTLNFFNEREAG